jgi:hypothetical protein
MSLKVGATLLFAVGALKYPPWKVKTDGPLVTRFSKDVHPDTAWQEYPRPDLVRGNLGGASASWVSLNGLWEFDRFTEDLSTPPVDLAKQLPEQILVPFPAESAIGGVRNYSKSYSYWYRTSFPTPTATPAMRTLLNFEASDWNTTVYLNGNLLKAIDSVTHAPTNSTSHIGGYDSFTFDITPQLNTGKDNVLVVGVYDDTRMSGHDPQQMAGWVFLCPLLNTL